MHVPGKTPAQELAEQLDNQIVLNGVQIGRSLIASDFALAADRAAAKARDVRSTNHFTLMGQWLPHPELEGCRVCGGVIHASAAPSATLSANDGPAVPICEPCAVRLAVACDAQ